MDGKKATEQKNILLIGSSVIFETLENMLPFAYLYLLSTEVYSDTVRLIKESDHFHKRKEMLLTLPQEREPDTRISGFCLMDQSLYHLAQSFLNTHICTLLAEPGL